MDKAMFQNEFAMVEVRRDESAKGPGSAYTSLSCAE
jgi:hypothetical protein